MIGDSFTFRIGLQDPAMATAVEDQLTIRIVEEEALPAKPKGKKRRPNLRAGRCRSQGRRRDAPTHGLPKYGLLTKDGRKIGLQEANCGPKILRTRIGG